MSLSGLDDVNSIEREDNYMLLTEKYVEIVVAYYFRHYVEILPKNMQNEK
jgi:hypothetical protein